MLQEQGLILIHCRKIKVKFLAQVLVDQSNQESSIWPLLLDWDLEFTPATRGLLNFSTYYPFLDLLSLITLRIANRHHSTALTFWNPSLLVDEVLSTLEFEVSAVKNRTNYVVLPSLTSSSWSSTSSKSISRLAAPMISSSKASKYWLECAPCEF
jgi:hypothetical protein